MNTKTQQDQSIWRKKYAEIEEKTKKVNIRLVNVKKNKS